jgi:hypothetical protein
MNDDKGKERDPSAQPEDIWPPADEWPEEAHAASTFFAAALFLIQEGWNRLEDLGWVEKFGARASGGS